MPMGPGGHADSLREALMRVQSWPKLQWVNSAPGGRWGPPAEIAVFDGGPQVTDLHGRLSRGLGIAVAMPMEFVERIETLVSRTAGPLLRRLMQIDASSHEIDSL